jgi:hypothetical protein
VTISAVAFVPSAPLLVPGLAGGSANLDADIRDTCVDLASELIASSPNVIAVVAPAASAHEWPDTAAWDFAGFGVPRRSVPGAPTLPWQTGLGAWLLDEAGWRGRRRYLGVAEHSPPIGPSAGRLAMLAVGGGSACRTERAPGHFDPRAEIFDATIATHLAAGDATAFADLDADLAAELMCDGLPVWQWVAAQLDGARPTATSLKMHDARYGVAYFVASWRFA